MPKLLNTEVYDEVITVDKVGCKNGINLGDGCILVVADKSGVCDKSLKEKLLGFTSDDIRIKPAVTDENLSIGRILGLGKGAKCAAVGIAVSNNDKTFESVNKSDFDEAVKFLTEVIKHR